MKDFARLAVGVALLALAIYVTLQMTAPSATNENDELLTAQRDLVAEQKEPAATRISPSSVSAPPGRVVSAAAPDRLSPDLAKTPDGTVAPVFSNDALFAEVGPTSNASAALQVEQPPRISDQYRPTAPIQVSNRPGDKHLLVPVQPRPSFSTNIQPSGVVHIVREGDTLQSISREYFGTANRYLDIYVLNRNVVSDPANLPANVELIIPAR